MTLERQRIRKYGVLDSVPANTARMVERAVQAVPRLFTAQEVLDALVTACEIAAWTTVHRIASDLGLTLCAHCLASITDLNGEGVRYRVPGWGVFYSHGHNPRNGSKCESKARTRVKGQAAAEGSVLMVRGDESSRVEWWVMVPR